MRELCSECGTLCARCLGIDVGSLIGDRDTLTAEVERMQETIDSLRAENAELIVKNEQLYKDRYDALSVHTKEGMLASEWLLRTGKAERRVKELEAENAELREDAREQRALAEGLAEYIKSLGAKPGAGT